MFNDCGSCWILLLDCFGICRIDEFVLCVALTKNENPNVCRCVTAHIIMVYALGACYDMSLNYFKPPFLIGLGVPASGISTGLQADDFLATTATSL